MFQRKLLPYSGEENLFAPSGHFSTSTWIGSIPIVPISVGLAASGGGGCGGAAPVIVPLSIDLVRFGVNVVSASFSLEGS